MHFFRQTHRRAVLFEMLVKGVCLSAGKRKPSLYVFAKCIFYTLHPVVCAQWTIPSEYWLALSSPVKLLCQSLSVQPNEVKLETKTPISQAIRLLFCVLYSSSHANSYSFLFPSLICPSLAPLRFVFVSSDIVFCMKSRLGDIHCNAFFPHTEIIYNSLSLSLFLLFIFYLSLLLYLSFRLSLHLFQPALASSSITGGLV